MIHYRTGNWLQSQDAATDAAQFISSYHIARQILGLCHVGGSFCTKVPQLQLS